MWKYKKQIIQIMLTQLGIILLCVVIIAIFQICTWPIAEKSLKSLEPPSGVDTFSEFKETMGEPKVLYTIVFDDNKWYILWVGGMASDFAAPSGPSCYVFDAKGNLVLWSPKTGDGEPADKYLKCATTPERMDTIEKMILKNNK